jgi:hypothetical protein
MKHLNICQTSSVIAQRQQIGCSARCNIFFPPEIQSPKILVDNFNQWNAVLIAFRR